MNLAMSGVTGVAARKGLIYVTNTVTLTETDQHVRASTVSANNGFTITLAPAEDMTGKFVYIYMVARNSSDDIVITGADEGTDITLNAVGENVLLFSTGVEYIAIYSDGPTVKG